MVASPLVEDTRTLVHRIRNDLQLVSSIIHAEMALALTDEARAALSAMDRRMLAINLSYTGDETTHVHLPRYLADLCAGLGQRLLACPDRRVDTVTARRMGMIAAEAMGAANCAAELTLVATGGSIEIRLTRDKSHDAWMTGLCRELVLDLIQQLGGSVIGDGPDLLSFAIPET
jgi:two-component sensor histidine kinase